MRGSLKWIFKFVKWLIDHELVGAFFEVYFSLECLGFAGGRRKDRIFVLHDLFI